MKRPEFIESLKARASLSNRVSIGGNNALLLIRYVEVLERALDNAIADNKDADTLEGYLEVAEWEAQP